MPLIPPLFSSFWPPSWSRAHHTGGWATITACSPLSLPLALPVFSCSGQSAWRPTNAPWPHHRPTYTHRDSHHHQPHPGLISQPCTTWPLPHPQPISGLWNPNFGHKGVFTVSLVYHNLLEGQALAAAVPLCRGLFLSRHPFPRDSDQVLPPLDTQPGSGALSVLPQSLGLHTLSTMGCHRRQGCRSSSQTAMCTRAGRGHHCGCRGQGSGQQGKHRWRGEG